MGGKETPPPRRRVVPGLWRRPQTPRLFLFLFYAICTPPPSPLVSNPSPRAVKILAISVLENLSSTLSYSSATSPSMASAISAPM